jgi:GDPmannose 4,6-dehydratase
MNRPLDGPRKTALITGIDGQDGSYLAELLLAKGYRVVGFLWRGAVAENSLPTSLSGKVTIAHGDLLDQVSIFSAINEHQPDELYNLASQSSPADSWRMPVQTGEVTALGAQRVFDTVRQVKPSCRIYQASSSEMFGRVTQTPQNEGTPFDPANPYAAAKMYAHNIARIYREGFGLFVSCGILFNHESPRRPLSFLTQKVTYAAACLKLGMKDSPARNEAGEPILANRRLALGNLEARRDWGFAGDYVEAMWLMLQQSAADDFVIGTGRARTVRELCEQAFSYVGLDWREHVVSDPRFMRPAETGATIADADKARRHLGWAPRVSFAEMITQMVDAHVARATPPSHRTS